MIRRPPRSTQSRSSAASDVYKRQVTDGPHPSGDFDDATGKIRAIETIEDRTLEIAGRDPFTRGHPDLFSAPQVIGLDRHEAVGGAGDLFEDSPHWRRDVYGQHRLSRHLMDL